MKKGTGSLLPTAATRLAAFVASDSPLYDEVKVELYYAITRILLNGYGDDKERKRAAVEVAKSAVSKGTREVAVDMVMQAAYVLKSGGNNDDAKSILEAALVEGDRETRKGCIRIINGFRSEERGNAGFVGALEEVIDRSLASIKEDMGMYLLQRV